MKNSGTDKQEAIKSEILHKREEWRTVRSLRMDRKNELIGKGLPVEYIRKERDYRRLKKEQKRLSKEIRHLEKK